MEGREGKKGEGKKEREETVLITTRVYNKDGIGQCTFRK
jgi:hypothetical protein